MHGDAGSGNAAARRMLSADEVAPLTLLNDARSALAVLQTAAIIAAAIAFALLTAARTNRPWGNAVDVVGRVLLFPHHHLPRLHRLLLQKGALQGAEVRDLSDTLALIFAPRATQTRQAELT